WQSMGCAETVALTLPGYPSHATHDALVQPSPAARGLPRRLAVTPLQSLQRCDGEVTEGLPRKEGGGGWVGRWVWWATVLQ
ncbi:MAG: hypothetical protein NT154_26050, partial [Verrucomicrobia bacterium]|nr:hypothetical protein [Verrucomicrobiota bacterium]